MRLLVTGARIWDSQLDVDYYLTGCLLGSAMTGVELIIVHGDCPTGADSMASNWAKRNNVKEEKYPAEWDKYGKAAGHIRNKQMVDTKPDRAVAFIRGEARGTNNCIGHLERAGIPYDRITRP